VAASTAESHSASVSGGTRSFSSACRRRQLGLQLEAPRGHLLAQGRTGIGLGVEALLRGLEAPPGRLQIEPRRVEGAAEIELELREPFERPGEVLRRGDVGRLHAARPEIPGRGRLGRDLRRGRHREERRHRGRERERGAPSSPSAPDRHGGAG
jgi:hypothetical protein